MIDEDINQVWPSEAIKTFALPGEKRNLRTHKLVARLHAVGLRYLNG